eukprot:gene6724-4819_t
MSKDRASSSEGDETSKEQATHSRAETGPTVLIPSLGVRHVKISNPNTNVSMQDTCFLRFLFFFVIRLFPNKKNVAQRDLYPTVLINGYDFFPLFLSSQVKNRSAPTPNRTKEKDVKKSISKKIQGPTSPTLARYTKKKKERKK